MFVSNVSFLSNWSSLPLVWNDDRGKGKIKWKLYKKGKKHTIEGHNDTSRDVRKIKAAAVLLRGHSLCVVKFISSSECLSFRSVSISTRLTARRVHSLLEVKRNLIRRFGPSLLSVLSLSLVTPFSRPSPSVFPTSFLSFVRYHARFVLDLCVFCIRRKHSIFSCIFCAILSCSSDLAKDDQKMMLFDPGFSLSILELGCDFYTKLCFEEI